MNLRKVSAFQKRKISQAEEREAWSPDSTGAMQVGQVKDLNSGVTRWKKGPQLPDQPIVDAFGVVEVNAGQVADGHAFFKVFKANRALFRSFFFFCPFCDLRKFRF